MKTIDRHQEIIREVKRIECLAINNIPDTNDYLSVLKTLSHCKNSSGKIVITGIGKASSTAQRFALTFSSIGCPAIYMNALDALYGEVGVISANDVIFFLDNTGANPALINLIEVLNTRKPKVPIILLTGNAQGAIVPFAKHVLLTGKPEEVCVLGLTPTSSMTAMGVICHILLVLIQRHQNFTEEDFKNLHFNGYLGIKIKQIKTSRLKLTEKELFVLNQMHLGVNRKSIALNCGISPSGVDYHIRNIYKKLQVNNAQTAIEEAINLGILVR